MTQPSAERRVVTAMFVDVVGSTALGLQLGPERLKRMLERTFSELKGCIDAEGGTVEKYVGDAIHALFGAPVAHVDDPRRALRAALACVRLGDANGRAPSALRVRVGVETGEAIVDLAATEGGHQQMSIGTCVNLAARLQQAADPGDVLVGPICRDATAEAAEFEFHGEIDLKGLGAIAAWRLVSLDESHPRARVAFVGRRAEREVLDRAFQRARGGDSVLTVISGPPGQGKTRLVEEFIRGLDPGVRVLKARCRPSGERGHRSPLRELLDDEPLRADALEHLFADPLERQRVATALAFGTGAAASSDLEALPAGQRSDEIANGWRRYFAEIALRSPLVVWVDDLHWAEAETVQLLDRLTFGAAAPFLVIGTARPEFRASARLRGGTNRVFIALDPLGADDARMLAQRAGAVDSAVHERAGGNPLFIIELTRASAAATPDVPITLQGVIGARLDELPFRDRELLQRAAVVGETFTSRDAALLAACDPDDAETALRRLVDLHYLQHDDGAYRFHHALVRDVSYGRLTTADRMRLHAQYAREGDKRHDPEAAAHHLWEAVGPADAEWVWESATELNILRELARAAHLAAAENYASRFAYDRSVETATRALLFAGGSEDAAQIEHRLAGFLGASGRADEAAGHYLRARDLYTEMGRQPPARLFPDLLEMPIYSAGMFMTPPSEALVTTLLVEGMQVARTAGDAESVSRMAALEAYRAQDPRRLDAALELSRSIEDPTSLVTLLGHAAILQNRTANFRDARRTFARLDAVGPAGVADQRFEYRAILELNEGNIDEADRLARRFLETNRTRGPHLKTHAFREHSHVLLARGEWAALRALAVETDELVAAHPETAFCYAVTTLRAFSVVADVMTRGYADQSQVDRAVMPLQAEIFEREAVLLLLHGVVGRPDRVDALLGEVDRAGTSPFWFLMRNRAAVLTMLGRWNDLDRVLPPLEQLAGASSRYVTAFVAAVREERAAARGGPLPTHRGLRDLGYLGWSRLLAHRPSI